MRSAAFVRVGGFDPRYFLYFEETDLFARMLQQGCRWELLAGSPAQHAGAVSTDRRPYSTGFELGRSAALYMRHLGVLQGSAWLVLYLAGIAGGAVRRALQGSPRELVRTVAAVVGAALGTVAPRFESVARTRLGAAPLLLRRSSSAALANRVRRCE